MALKAPCGRSLLCSARQPASTDIVGKSPALLRVLEQVAIVAPTDSTVLLHGETGTGKELVARAIHNLSSRRERAYVRMNCAAIPSGLLESELFGHEKGAFTGALIQRKGRFEVADGGSLVWEAPDREIGKPLGESWKSNRATGLAADGSFHVPDLMRHDPGQPGFVIGSKNQPRVDVEKSARQANAFTSSESMTLIVNGT